MIKGILKHFSILFVLCSVSPVSAGPPFATDDPEPVEYRHWEIFLAAVYSDNSGGQSGVVPQLDLNYGLFSEAHLNVVVPFAFEARAGGPSAYGIGDMELALKMRLFGEDSGLPQAAFYPRVVLPTGDSLKGLGSGQTRFFLPLWVQKNWDSWKTYGGGGYWINPGPGNTDWIFLGWEIQKDISPFFTLGAEVLFHTPSETGDGNHLGWNTGGVLNLDEINHLMLSLGQDFVWEEAQFNAYFAYQWTF